MARHFASFLPQTDEDATASRVPAIDPRPTYDGANATGCDRRTSASRRLHHGLAADEPRELTQPHEYTLPRERLEAVIEAQ
jgi:hypothetical protein